MIVIPSIVFAGLDRLLGACRSTGVVARKSMRPFAVTRFGWRSEAENSGDIGAAPPTSVVDHRYSDRLLIPKKMQSAVIVLPCII